MAENIFYVAYKLLYQDLEIFLSSNRHGLLRDVPAQGLGVLKSSHGSHLDKAEEASRVRFLYHYVEGLGNRSEKEVKENFSHLLRLKECLHSFDKQMSSSIQEEFNFFVLEKQSALGISPLSDENIRHIPSVSILYSNLESEHKYILTFQNFHGLDLGSCLLQQNVSQIQDFASLSLAIAQIIAADALSFNMKRTQNFGMMLAQALPDAFGMTPFEGFSYYSKEKCHESVHGNGTCDRFLSRDDNCKGTAQPAYFLSGS